MKKLFALIPLVLLELSFFAQPGKDGAYTASTPNQVLNKYCPVAANISAGSNTLLLSSGPGFSLCPGDLLMIYQAQGCAINTTNTINYGSVTAYNSAGLYEFKYVQNVNGNTITVQSAFTNSYAIAGRVQAVKVPQYTTLTINGGASIVAKAWKDTIIAAINYRFGGLVVIHATSIINNGIVSASGVGFRGGALVNSAYINNIATYYTPVAGEGAEKGEGIFGYQTDYDAIGGRNGRGAAGNAGGGANSTNAPGGGGANGNNGNNWTGQGVMIVNATNPVAAWALDPGYIANANSLTNSSGGGRGGYCWAGSNLNALVQGPGDPAWGGDSRREAGGLGGRPLNNINAETRIYFGGGGGAGHENNSAGSAGGNGGGIVYLIATTGITGTGTITSIGNTAGNTSGCHCDGVGAGGAGGSIVLKTGAIVASQNVIAIGGNGGNQLILSNESEGPGGGGGGGFAAISAGGVAPNVNGGLNGNTTSAAVTEMTYNGATQGAVGQTGTVSSTFIPFSPVGIPVTAAPTTTQSTCTNTNNAFNLGLTLNPPNLSYTITWAPIPAGVVNSTQTAANGGISPGVYNATINTAGGCAVPVTTSFTINPVPAPLSFSVNPSYSITCTQSFVLVSLNPANSYTWTSAVAPPKSGPTVSFTSSDAGTWTVNASNANGCTGSQTFAIGQNTAAPVNSVAPASQVITCAGGAPVTFTGTATTPTVNVQHDWYSPLSPLPGGPPIATSNNSISILSGSIAPGVYTLVTTNLVNGCTALKTVTITSLDAWPTFGINSTTNYSVGCAPLNQTTLSIINPISTQSPAATCSFTFLPPGFGGTLAAGPYGVNAATVTTIPGTWTVIVNDNSNSCKTILTVPIVQNTVAPNVSANLLTQTLTCNNPTVLAVGTSSTPNSVISWDQPIPPPSVPSSTIVVGPGSGPNTSTTSLTYANYTVVATNSVNACISTSVVTINQNFKPPVSSPTISIGTPTAIYCNVATNPVILTTGTSTTTSGGGAGAFAVPYLWEGPAPLLPITGASSYSAFVAGVYTLTIKDNYNGCLKTGTINVVDKTQPPVLTNPVDQSTVDCGAASANLCALITGSTSGLRVLFTSYPPGAAFSPTSATVLNVNPYLSGSSVLCVSVSLSGNYEYVISNTVTGCQASGSFVVADGEVTAEFTPDKISGYAPLTVDFTNTSYSSLNTNSISSLWSFGNGNTYSTSANSNASTTYPSPGTYTVTLFAQKGSCTDTTYKIIKVDLPSKLEVPNIFTPNGDGSNDVFFLKTANLGEITAIIFDRWGNKVYETTSATGNIAWDGKNLQGKDCAPGVYFYIVKATGKDAQDYEKKGNVSLFR